MNNQEWLRLQLLRPTYLYMVPILDGAQTLQAIVDQKSHHLHHRFA